MNDNNNKEFKTPEYTRRANKNYQAKRDVITLSLEKGTKDRLKEKCNGKSLNAYLTDLIEKDLNEQPAKKTASPDDVFKPL